ncbi:SDR family oxidoreductase [Catenulispora subtropica]|uniref:SDR family oxidoreductase n=1 Tax=Catenulispora subtropica TaxID=450798 RepID=A0ABP5CBV1_9ACTN
MSGTNDAGGPGGMNGTTDAGGTTDTDRVVLITGCSSGIGLETAVAAAGAGFRVVATMRDPDKAGPLLQAASGASVAVDVRRLDVTDEESIDACLKEVLAEYGRLDIVVNNAGGANSFATIETATMAEYRANLEVNFFGVVAVTRAALPHLRATGGRVVTVGSTRGLIGQPFNEGYSAAKFAVEGFFESLAPTVAAMGVSVVLVEPGPVLGTAWGPNSGLTREGLLTAAGPYADILERYMAWVADSGYPGAQNGAEVAEVVVEALKAENPDFRIPTSAWAREYAALKLVEVSGAAVQDMARTWLA